MALDAFYWVQPKPRIVQHKGERYALRLETIFWQQLEFLAKRRGTRLGQLVAELDEAHRLGNAGPNLSSYIRGFCMIEAEKDANRFRLSSGAFDLLDILRGSPSPAMLLTQDRVIWEINPALMEWAGTPGQVFRQRKFDEVFAPRTARPLDETIQLLRSGQLKRTQIQVVFNNARTVVATMTGLSVGNIFYCLVWLQPSQQARIVAR